MRLIDAGMLAFAGYHALKGRVEWPLTFQVPRMLRATLRDEGPEPYALFWNAGRLRKREMWPAYRDRPEIWDEAGREDFEAMTEALAALGAVQFRADGWEADEALAALVHALRSGAAGSAAPGSSDGSSSGPAGPEDSGSDGLDGELVIHSDDKDFMQLLSGSVRMMGRRRGEVRHSDVKGILGVTPAYVADFLALAGDEADGIPGVVPPSVARELIDSRGHVRDWLDRDLRIREEVKEAIRGGRDQIRLNLRLVDLSQEVVGPPPAPRLEGWGDLDRAREVGERTGIGWLQEPDLAEEYAILREWGERTREGLAQVEFRPAE